MKTISIMNIKGGVGKTVTTVNLAVELAEELNRRVLVIDADPQADTTAFFGTDTELGSLAELMQGRVSTYRALTRPTAWEGVDILPCDSSLFDVDRTSLLALDPAALTNLREACEEAAENDDYDVVLIDCPPSFTASSVAALMASDYVIIPVKLDAFSLRGMAFLEDQISEVRRINRRIKIAGCLVTMWHNCEVTRQAEVLLRSGSIPVFDTNVRRSDKVDESTFMSQPLKDYSKTSSAGKDYNTFAWELLKREVV